MTAPPVAVPAPRAARDDGPMGRARTIRAIARSVVFVAKMSPVRQNPIDRITRRPAVEHLSYPTPRGTGVGELYRPRTRGRHPGIVVSLGVLPVGVEDPRVVMVGEAFARSGFVTLLHWSPAMRDLRLDPDDIPDLVVAYEILLARPDVDPRRSGLFGVCVGGAFALLAAARPAIRDKVGFVALHSPYSSLRTMAVAIASERRTVAGHRERSQIDPLTWQVWVRSLTERLPAHEAAAIRHAFEGHIAWNADKTAIIRTSTADRPCLDGLSSEAQAVMRLLLAGPDDVAAALDGLPPDDLAILDAMSPLPHAAEVRAPLIILIHDRADHLIPVDESRRLLAALRGRPGVTYTEMGLNHLRVPAGWSRLRMAREMLKGYLAWYPLFRATTT
jgi:dienelactone hydrolase